MGAALSLVGTRFLRAVLYGVSAADPVTLAAAVSMLIVVAAAAAYAPVARAARVDLPKALTAG